MDLYSKCFDFTNENTGFNGVKANCILELSYQSFAVNDISKGENYIKEFEKLMTTKSETKLLILILKKHIRMLREFITKRKYSQG